MRVVQVGLGGFGRNWAREVVPRVPEVEVVATADVFEGSRAAALAEGLTTEDRCFATTEEALAATRPDAVLVTASLVGHVPAARAALEAGCHVLVEKPFAPSVAEAEGLVALAERQGRVLAVSQNYRFFPAPQTVREIVADGRYGPLHGIAIDFRQFSGADGVATPHHALDEPLLVDMSIHHLDLLRSVLGRDITAISCRTWDPGWSMFSGPSEGVALIESGDLVTSYRGSWVSSGERTTWAGEWRMDFAQAEVWWTSRGDGPEGWRSDEVRVRRLGEVETLTLPRVERTDRTGSLTEFATAIAEGRQPHISGRDNLGTLAATYAAVEAARTGETVRVAARS
ncbi:Gfo/Idh/MocA family protein [Desertihabitans aurantiacus]|uniref:Gfo/Idh/MocA family protein n=1 Tax=Desertihabitans aurantiacus TaxID=2282477 RepID=UPI000DF784EC|nr:Gfo/Idh/MocA family oxidoreductase [Desertihabitans aurantiacus]